MLRTFTIEIDDTGAVEYHNDGLANYELIGIMRIVEATLLANFVDVWREGGLKARGTDESGLQEAAPSGTGES